MENKWSLTTVVRKLTGSSGDKEDEGERENGAEASSQPEQHAAPSKIIVPTAAPVLAPSAPVRESGAYEKPARTSAEPEGSPPVLEGAALPSRPKTPWLLREVPQSYKDRHRKRKPVSEEGAGHAAK